MTPEEHYRAGEQLLGHAQTMDPSLPAVTTEAEALRLAHAEFRAAEVGSALRERWGHDELPRVAERPLDIADLAAMNAERRTARALDAVKAVTVGWAKGQYDDKLDAFDAVRAIIDGQPDGPGTFDEPGVRYVPADRRAEQTVTKINGTLRELDRIVNVYAQRTSAEDLAYGRGLANAVQRIHDAMDRGQ
jgi:hypothetical protein